MKLGYFAHSFDFGKSYFAHLVRKSIICYNCHCFTFDINKMHNNL